MTSELASHPASHQDSDRPSGETNGWMRLAKSMMIALLAYHHHLNNNITCTLAVSLPFACSMPEVNWMAAKKEPSFHSESHDRIQFPSESMNVACSTQFSNSFSSGSTPLLLGSVSSLAHSRWEVVVCTNILTSQEDEQNRRRPRPNAIRSCE